jgi:phage tail-like protein
VSTHVTQGNGFTTIRRRRLQQAAPSGGPPPAVASRRSYLRSGLPPVYQAEDFGLRYVGALEQLLDPPVALLDALPRHFSSDLGPLDLVELMTAWVGANPNESWSEPVQRDWLRQSAELTRRRGTRAGLELALRTGFPDLPFRVEDSGRAAAARSEDELPDPGAPSFVVYCDVHVPEEVQATIARLIDDVKPVHVSYRLRVRTRKQPSSSGGSQ